MAGRGREGRGKEGEGRGLEGPPEGLIWHCPPSTNSAAFKPAISVITCHGPVAPC